MDTTPTISEFIQSGRASTIRGFELYAIDNEVAVDQVSLFEQLAEAGNELEKRLGLPGKLDIPVIKAQYRRDRRHYRDILSARDRDILGKAYAREIAHFGYEW